MLKVVLNRGKGDISMATSGILLNSEEVVLAKKQNFDSYFYGMFYSR